MARYLVIRFSSIGDIVLTTAVIRCLKQQLQHDEVHYLTRKSNAQILEANPYIDKIYSVEKSAKEVIKELKKERYDAVIDLHHNARSLYVKSMLGVRSYSFRKLNIQKWLLVNFKVNRLPHLHIVDRYFETVQPLDVYNDGKGLDYFIPEGSEVDVRNLSPELTNGYVAFVIGARHFTKMYPMEKVADVCSRLPMPVVLLGGKEDESRAEMVIQMIEKQNPLKTPHIYNAAGKFNLHQSASIVKQADIVITNDTGLMHVAAAFNKKIISLWGNTVPEFGMYPYAPGNNVNRIFEVKDLYCRPCSKIGFDKCPQKHFQCMNGLSPDEIIKCVEEMKSVANTI